MTAQVRGRARRDSLVAAGPPASGKLFTALLTRGTATRAELSARTGYTPGAVTKALRPLLAAGLVREVAQIRTGDGAGRPAVVLEVDAERAYLVGVKITGHEVVGVLTDLRAQVLETAHVPVPAVPAAGSHADTLAVATAVAGTVAVVDRLLRSRPRRRTRVRSVVVAVSGDVDAESGVVRFAPLLGWRDVPLGAQLTEGLGLPVTIENDVRALTVAEQWFGAGREHRSFALVTVGTGVGCGAVVGGELVAGAHGVAGELGHVAVDPRGPRCHCGGIGCIEALIGEAALLDRLSAALGADVESLASVLPLTGRAAVRSLLEDAGRVLGLALATVANLYGPERIVLTGETLVLHDEIAAAMLATFEQQCFGAAGRCDVVVRPVRFEHWARGAAAVAIARAVRQATTAARER